MAYLIFDFNGTLVNDFPMTVEMIRIAFGKWGIDMPLSTDQYRQVGLAKMMKELKISKLKLVKAYRELKPLIRQRQLDFPLVDKMADLLPRLAKKHKLLILSSNQKESITQYLEFNNIKQYFDSVHEDNSFFGKHVGLQKIMDKLGLNPVEVFYLGDEVRDVLAANKVGVNSVAVSWGYEGEKPLQAANPKHLLTSVDQIANL